MRFRRHITVTAFVVLAFFAGVVYSRKDVNGRAEASGRRILYYHDPMHPSYRSDKPGIAPDCGMQLQPVYADSGASGGAGPALKLQNGIQISAEKQQLIGIKTERAEITPGLQSIRTTGRVAIDESRLYRLNAATDGWIQEMQPILAGSFVREDQNLAAYYTRELRSAVQAYFYVLDRTRSPEAANGPDAGLDRRGLELAIEGLRNLGMSDSQIREIEKTRKAPQYVFLRSPATGFVVGKNITPLQRFNHGDELYRIADLRRVWILADLFQSETRFVQAAAPAHIILQHSSRIIQAKVSGTLPQFDEASRTLKVRIEVDNPGFTLKPDMFVDVEFPVRLPAGLTVPEDAVINSGQVKTVFIDMGGGRFEPRTVETGWRFGDRVQIVRGVAAGEKIVISGNFLMDSEVRMRREVTGMSGPQ